MAVAAAPTAPSRVAQPHTHASARRPPPQRGGVVTGARGWCTSGDGVARPPSRAWAAQRQREQPRHGAVAAPRPVHQRRRQLGSTCSDTPQAERQGECEERRWGLGSHRCARTCSGSGSASRRTPRHGRRGTRRGWRRRRRRRPAARWPRWGRFSRRAGAQRAPPPPQEAPPPTLEPPQRRRSTAVSRTPRRCAPVALRTRRHSERPAARLFWECERDCSATPCTWWHCFGSERQPHRQSGAS